MRKQLVGSRTTFELRKHHLTQDMKQGVVISSPISSTAAETDFCFQVNYGVTFHNLWGSEMLERYLCLATTPFSMIHLQQSYCSRAMKQSLEK
jgi:hypothetical protein